MCAYLSEVQPKEEIQLLLILPQQNGIWTIVSWKHDLSVSINDAITWCEASLPHVYKEKTENVIRSVTPVVRSMFQKSGIYLRSISLSQDKSIQTRFNLQVLLEDEQYLFPLTSNDVQQNVKMDSVVKNALSKFSSIVNDEILSIECGHIHLDRDIDMDQEFGMAIGSAVFQYLTQRQFPPYLAPMIDDDHVLIQLKPEQYFEFFLQKIGGEDISFELIPESSPIIRAITTALYARLQSSENFKFVEQQGGNLYLHVDSHITCELFEDFHGRCDNGCVFFEVALLLFRSAPQFFSEYFHRRFPLVSMPKERNIFISCSVQ